jgi:hypothetical protein
VHAPFEAEGDLVVLVVRFGVIAAQAKWHDCEEKKCSGP